MHNTQQCVCIVIPAMWLLHDAVNRWPIYGRVERCYINGELKRLGRKRSLLNVKSILKISPNGLRKITKTSAKLMLRPRFDSSTSRIQVYSVTAMPTWSVFGTVTFRKFTRQYSPYFSYSQFSHWNHIQASEHLILRILDARGLGAGARDYGRPAST
jgi:hypothetical protein